MLVWSESTANQSQDRQLTSSRYCVASSATGVTASATGTASTTGISSASSSSATASSNPLTTEERESLFELHENLVNIPSISDDEIECAEWLEEYLREKGYFVERVPVTAGAEGRFNVFAYPTAIRDNGSWPEVLVTSHIDTVSRLQTDLTRLITKMSRYRLSFPSKHAKRMAQRTTSAAAASTPKAPSQP